MRSATWRQKKVLTDQFKISFSRLTSSESRPSRWLLCLQNTFAVIHFTLKKHYYCHHLAFSFELLIFKMLKSFFGPTFAEIVIVLIIHLFPQLSRISQIWLINNILKYLASKRLCRKAAFCWSLPSRAWNFEKKKLRNLIIWVSNQHTSRLRFFLFISNFLSLSQ